MADEFSEKTTIESKLWQMANSLRGNMSANEFQNYILGFMFYRYLSTRQEKYLIDQDLLDLSEGQEPNAAYLTIPNGELNDYLRDISSTLGYAMRPEFTWKSLITNIDNNTINASTYEDAFKTFEDNAEINNKARQDFRNIFGDINLNDNRLGTSPASRAKALNQIVIMINEIDLMDTDGRDILGTAYEFLIKKFAANSGKSAGEFYTPHEVSVILSRLVTQGANPTGTYSVYDPTMGSGSLLLTVQQQLVNGNKPGRVQFYGQELNTTTFNLARMNLMMHDVDYQNMDLRNANTLESDWPDGEVDGIDRPRRFDAVVANPPYSAHWDNNDNKLKDPRFKDYGKLAPKTKADYAFVLHGIYHLNPAGTAAIILPHGVLFRGAAEGTIRQTLIEKNYLDAVIGLPAGIFYSTGIPTVILVFKKNRPQQDILFIDASKGFEKGKNQNLLKPEHIDRIIKTYVARQDVKKFAHVATLDEIKENNYNLNIPRYVDTFEAPDPIDIKKVKQQIAQVDQEIADAVADFEALASQLVEIKQDDKK